MRMFVFLLATGLGLYAAARWWRGHRRVGADFMNRTVNPWMLRRGLITDSRGELGLIEHVGRRSGIVRRTPVHPVPTEDGFRIIVPIGVRSEWARNVLAAQRCRLIVGDATFELEDPVLEHPMDVRDLPRPIGAVQEWLRFRYLRLTDARRADRAPAGRSIALTAPDLEGAAA